jgi:hypothetical protein
LTFTWLAAYLMGLAVVKALLPEDLDRDYGTFITPTVGYLVFCLGAFSVSAAFGLAAASASWIVMGVLAAAGLATQLRPSWRLEPKALGRDLWRSLILMLPMGLLTLFPFFYLGAETYVGAVNPDFFAGVVDNYYLLQGHSVTTFASTLADSFHPVERAAGHITASGRFASGLFAIAMTLLIGVEVRTAMALVIAFFMLSLPLTLYFFCRVVMLFEERAARLAAWLIGLSAPTAMSYLYFYLGQNSGLPALPLVLSAAYLMLVRPGSKTVILCALLANALFINYFAMLPYALAPAGALGLYLIVSRRLSIALAARLLAGFLLVTAAALLANLPATMQSMRMWLGVIGQSLQGPYFLDFLTEAFFYYFLGIYNYQTSHWAILLMGQTIARFVGFAVALACFGLLLWFMRLWARDTQNRESRIFVLSALLIYASVWWLYSFPRQYGYAVFKMSSWLQFIVVPFMAYGIHRLLQRSPRTGFTIGARAASVTAIVVCTGYVALNLAANLQYASDGLGRNTDNGYIVNHFEVSGNRDYFELPAMAARHVKPDESIGLLFTDSIRNWWTSYYLKGHRQSILSHDMLPGEDENLPDIETNVVVDYYGNVERRRTDYFHGGSSDQFYLTRGSGDINRDIVSTDIDATPLWENKSFRLFRASDAHDILTTGRGFYRLEYFKPVKDYFFPRVLRWSAEGGEFYLLRPKHPGQPYRLAFDALVGYEYPTDSRTLELWHNGRKFQEIVITHSARVVSEPFYPSAGANKLVVHIKERNRPLAREFWLWNKDIPADYRRMNAAFANARILTPDRAPSSQVPKINEKIEFLRLHSVADEFNGLQLDGWVGDGARVVMPVPSGAKQLEVAGFVPGNLGFKFPFALKIGINGREFDRVVAAAGPFALQVPLVQGESRASLSVTPSESRELGEQNIRHKVIKQSLRLESITFR